ncbi:MAG: OmpA family protein, partial [bacterium]
SEGIFIHVAETASFREGSAELLDQGIPLYNNILNLILRTSNTVRIEGHTDNADIRSSEARDNWDLSARRAMAVFRFFTTSGEVPESRFSVVGYGKQRPLVSNLTEAGRARNRRVTVVFVGKLKPLTE